MKLNKLDYILIIAVIHMELWGTIFFVGWCLFNTEPTTLESVMIPISAIELLLAAVIKIKKKPQPEAEQSQIDDIEIIDLDDVTDEGGLG
ncbi:hypothetical protein [Lachnoclostridium sp. Marseille-P6806]|uniref:hypothetical protein n=1 Tax=Lachnoclostridium sp. Marseille-P6806 TaxID=2364793 RepID=UPI00102F9DA8|nr:hypothetical protein [Lachnoclostridium sp. Marseille-P6806]